MNLFNTFKVRLGIILLLSLCKAEFADSQERSLTIVGTAEYNFNPLANVKVTLLKEGNIDQTIYTSSDGIFRFSLLMNENYTVLLEKPGLLSKKIAFNTELPDDIVLKWTNEFAISLFEGCEGVNTSILEQPVDVIKFSANKSEFISDKAYVEKIRTGIEKLLTDIEFCQTDKVKTLTREADQLYNKKQYAEAKVKYEEALKIFPEDSYCQKRITDINIKIGEDKEAGQKYTSAIQEADQLYANKSYELAKLKYQEALKIMPSSNYPREKITTIDNLLQAKQNIEQEKLDKEKNYNSLISKANLAVNNQDLEGAKSLYQQALLIKPDATFPKQKINDLEPLIAQQKQKNEEKTATLKSFNEAMAMGQAAIQKNDLETAKQHFNKALMINPQSDLPKQKIAEIDKQIAELKQTELKAQKSENEKKITTALDEGDMYFQQKNYEAAETAYQRALQLSPGDLYAKQRIDKIMSFKQTAEAEKQKTIEKAVTESVDKADNLMATASYQQAIEVYKQALLQKPDDAGLKNKLASAELKLAEENIKKSNEQAKKVESDQYLVKGNNFFNAKNYLQAKDAYQKALDIYPDQSVARNKIIEIDKILTAQKQQEQYKEQVAKADLLFTSKDFSNAKAAYQQALATKSDEVYPQQKITEIDKIISENKKLVAEQTAREEQFKLAISEGDKSMSALKLSEAKLNYQKALAIKPADAYPTSQITKIDALIAEQLKKDSEAKAKEQQYNSAIKLADQLLAANKNTEAKSAYQQALALKPGDAYPTSQIAKIDALIAEQLKKDSEGKAKEQQYNSAIKLADQLLAAQKSAEAKSAYQQALSIKPGDAYPTSQIAKIDALIAEQLKKDSEARAKEQQYNSAIKLADQLLAAQKNAEAKSAYQQALSIKPGDAYPTSKIAKIDALIAEQLKKDSEAKAKEQQYNSAIKLADQLLAAQKNAEAKSAYQQALAIKPGDAYPTSQIAKIDALIAEQLKKDSEAKAKEQQYNSAIKLADQLLASQKNAEAKSAYQQALAIKPADAYPMSQITKIDALIAEQLKKDSEARAKEQQYNSAIKLADQLFAAQKNAEAKSAYQQALAIKPGDAYPTSQITKIDALIANQLKKENDAKANEQKYKTAIAQADQFFASEKLIEAKSYYEQSLKIKSGDPYPTSQVQKIDARLVQLEKEKQAKNELDQKYNKAIQDADLAFNNKDFERARGLYNQALTMKPSEVYPKERLNKITDIERILAQEQAAKKQVATTTTKTDKPKSTSKLADLKFANDSERDKYLNGLRDKYPVGVTLEVHKEEFRTINRYIVIRDNEVREFRKITFSYGGIEYSINGIPATGQYFDSQVKTRAGEKFQELEM
jgi:tetratricopeptide (TPR) repeat protein